MQRFFNKDNENNQSPSKWKSKNLFSLNEDSYVVKYDTRVYPVKKIKNQHNWFFKTYSTKQFTCVDSHPYELEAISGELYRFILGPDRAAKSRVVTDNDHPYLGSISAENLAGFKDIRKTWDDIKHHYFWSDRISKFSIPSKIQQVSQSDYNKLTSEEKETDFQNGVYYFVNTGNDKKDNARWIEMIEIIDHYYSEFKINYFREKYLTYENGMAEVNMAMRILDEADAGVQNLGLNNDKEISRIDYDFTLNNVRKDCFDCTKHSQFDTIRCKPISSLFVDCENNIPRNNRTVKNRFYQCQLLTLLLNNNDVMTTLCKRHTTSEQLIFHVHKIISNNITLLQKSLYESDEFNEFMSEVEFSRIERHIERIFRYENEHSKESYERMITIIKNSFEEIKESALIKLNSWYTLIAF